MTICLFSFLQKCTITSNRIATWVLQLQEYGMEISRISGTQNYLTDIISHNPAGLTPEHIKQLTRLRDIMVATIKLKIDSQVKKEQKELAAFQDKDSYIKTFKDHVTNQSAKYKTGGMQSQMV